MDPELLRPGRHSRATSTSAASRRTPCSRHGTPGARARGLPARVRDQRLRGFRRLFTALPSSACLHAASPLG
eukprot:614687-Alexandrium_andersonii.AAC.1